MSAHSAAPNARNAPSLARRAREALTPHEWRRVAWLAAAIAALHAVGFFVLLVLVVPRGLTPGDGGALGAGVGLTAYVLGVRHAFDADHIAAIDGTTRKLMADRQRPLGVGFSFSLGHATVVFALVALVGLGVHGLGADLSREDSWWHEATGVVGPLVSGTLLLLIGLVNLTILSRTMRAARSLRHGEADERAIERGIAGGGLLARVYGKATRAVSRSWHAYPLGVLFGLGFDTATEVALLLLAGGATLSGMPFYAILCLPVLFAAGMSLFDTLDGLLMRVAYGRAVGEPARRVRYDVVVTGLSAAVALSVGAVQLSSALSGPAIGLAAGGYAIVAAFAATWALAGALALRPPRASRRA